MKRLRKVLTAAVMMICLLAIEVPVNAAEEDYTYTVRFYAGKQGQISGGEVVTFENLHYGDRVNFNQSMVRLKDDGRYYIRGIRESGRDNNEVYATSFTVTGDRDYVVAYGILGNAVAYTIHYEDEEGNELAPVETYYGNVGDMPVIAYLYIEGYQPQAYNLVRTLTENEAENVFTFVYSTTAGNAPAEEEPGGETPGAETPGGETPGAETPAAPGAAAPGTVLPGTTVPGTLTPVDDEGTPLAEPADLQQIDDEDTPKASFDENGKLTIAAEANFLGKLLLAVICVTMGALICLGIVLLIVTRRKKRNEER